MQTASRAPCIARSRVRIRRGLDEPYRAANNFATWRTGESGFGAVARVGRDARIMRALAKGEPSAAILEKAREYKAGLIVMGSRGLGQIGGLILGSVSERVLHGAHVPVLIVR
jgi:universal stress protein family protein